MSYFLTSVLVWLGVAFRIDYIPFEKDVENTSSLSLPATCLRFDAIHYASIVERGYSYDPRQRSVVAFFPAYPLTVRLLAVLTRWDTRLSLLVSSNFMLLVSFVLFSAYVRSRCPEDIWGNRFLVLGVFGLWPAGFFFRMGYSESTFLVFMLLVLYGMVRHWPLSIIAILCGIATAARPVGLAVSAAVAWYVHFDTTRSPVIRRLFLTVVTSIAASWGLIAYMTYQYFEFNNPFAFAQTQEHWRTLPLELDAGNKIESLLALEPIWGVYTSDPIRTWKRFDTHDNPFFSLFFWNPILFVAAFILVLFGAAKSWLSGPEIVLSLGLLGIPYVTRAYENSMDSHARFAAVVLPAYLVLGRLLQSRPDWVKWSVIGILSVMLMSWSALFAAGYLFF